MGACMKIGILAVFQKNCYKFGDRLYKQIFGGPTGLTVTCPVAKVRMTRFVRKLLNLLRRSGVMVEEIFVNVDDLRIILKFLVEGTVFCGQCNRFKLCPEQKERDIQSQETPVARTARVLNQAMNTIEPELSFTTESCEEFKSGRLRTLDYQVWVENMDHTTDPGTATQEHQEPSYRFPDPVPLTDTYWEG